VPGGNFLEAEVHYGFMMVIGALVNHNRGCFEECESTRIILFESGIHPWIKHLEDVRHGLRRDDDAVKCAIAERAVHIWLGLFETRCLTLGILAVGMRVIASQAGIISLCIYLNVLNICQS